MTVETNMKRDPQRIPGAASLKKSLLLVVFLWAPPNATWPEGSLTTWGLPTLNPMMAKNPAAMRYISMAMGSRYTLDSLARMAGSEFKWMLPHSDSPKAKKVEIQVWSDLHFFVLLLCRAVPDSEKFRLWLPVRPNLKSSAILENKNMEYPKVALCISTFYFSIFNQKTPFQANLMSLWYENNSNWLKEHSIVKDFEISQVPDPERLETKFSVTVRFWSDL